MSSVVVQLNPKQWGAELLVKLAQSRRSGTLRWGVGGEERLVFREGRPEQSVTREAMSADRREVVAAMRRFSLRSAGSCSFEPATSNGAGQLGIDTLGEVLVALCRELSAEQAAAFQQARGEQTLEPTAAFDKI